MTDDIKTVIRGLTPAQRYHVKNGCISGNFSMVTIRHLKAKGLFDLVISSPNGRAGFMELTPLGKTVQAALKAKEASQ